MIILVLSCDNLKNEMCVDITFLPSVPYIHVYKNLEYIGEVRKYFLKK